MGYVLTLLRSLHARVCGLLALLAVVVSSPTSAQDVKVPEPVFNATAAREFSQVIFDKITAKITHQTTFQQIGPEGLVRRWTRTIKLVDFVKAPSRTYPETYLYAMRYVVAVISEKVTLVTHATSCQVVVVYKDKEFDEPTVVCEPVNLDRPASAS